MAKLTVVRQSFIFVVIFSRVNMESTSLNNTSEAVRKRNIKKTLKEKRKEEKFLSRYIEIKHPDIHKEANNLYKSLVDKYPGRADITKTYFFKKWESKNQRKEPQLYVPFLPVLSELPETTCVETDEEGQQQEEIDEEGQQQEEIDEEGQQQEEIDEEGQQQEEIDEEGQQQEEIDEEGQQQEEIDEEGQQQEEIDEEGQQQESPQTPPQEGILEDFGPTMTINEMNIAVEEIIKALRSDSEVMDIVENFDLPAGVWDNELSIPDYILEDDLEW